MKSLMKFAETFISNRMKETFEQQKQAGCHCPLCGQYAKVYKRKITQNMVDGLLKLCKESEKCGKVDFYHISKFLGEGIHSSDVAKLKYWGLVDEKRNKSNNKRTSGYWRITTSGIDFINGQTTVRKYAHLYNGECIGFSGGHVSVYDCCGEKFNYKELMVA